MKKYIVAPGKQRIVGVDGVEDEEEYNQFDEVSFFVEAEMINVVEAKLSFGSVIPYIRNDGYVKLVQS